MLALFPTTLASRPTARLAAPRAGRLAARRAPGGGVARILTSAPPRRPTPNLPARPLSAPPAAAAGAGAVQGDMLTPSVFNKTSVRLGALALAALLSAGSSLGGGAAGTVAAHTLAWGVQFGTTIYTTFFAGILMFKNLPRQTFGKLQAHLFPAYFCIIAACLLIQAATLALSPVGLAQKQAVTLGVGMLATLANLAWAEPAATASMFKRYALENVSPGAGRDEATITSLKKEFGKLHGLSSLFNLAALICCVSHGVWLAGLVTLPAGAAVLLKLR